MTEQAKTHATRKWLQYAEANLRAARAAAADPAHFEPFQICFLSQQAAETALKAALLYNGTPFEHLHDLDTLASRLPASGWGSRSFAGRLARLTQYATNTRYPDPDIEPTRAEATMALQHATTVCRTVLRDLTAHGLSLPQPRRPRVSQPPNPQANPQEPESQQPPLS
jgi:HEPN domain-containing protein